MDETDSLIIKRMTEDARMSFRKIAKELGVSPDTVISRYRKLEEKGVIRGSTVVINQKNWIQGDGCIHDRHLADTYYRNRGHSA
ncbi:MAG TPA: AsnC family transcriptional regulator [Candidatus Bathyarchaeota archaeon]|nr:AsnC family transcriptional regulator [Candidatus Bathyarchaeota archaeon]